MKGRVLVVDDEPSMCELLVVGLARRGFDAVSRPSAREALALLDLEPVDVVVTDLNMREMSGIDLCERIAGGLPDVPTIVLTAFGSLEAAIAAIRVGAYDFITKPVELDALALAVERAVQHRALREEVKRLRRVVSRTDGFDEIVGSSAPMRAVYDVIDRIVDSDASVLITGQSGTGKEVVARALHRSSRRRSGPFVALNCAAMPEALLESELFGHVKGAFTDAKGARTGLFAEANHGTLLLDEIGDMPLGLQPKLLRVLQERRVRPVGSNAEVAVDVRVVAATHQDLETAVEERRFREDLFFRINVIHIALPPLQARGNDVLLLAQRFLAMFAERAGKKVVGFLPAAAERLMSYAWPGNVRELQNCVERSVALARFEQISVEDLPEKIRDYHAWQPAQQPSDAASELLPLEEVERRHIVRVLAAVAGNKTDAARILGFDRRTMYRKLERFGLSAKKDEA